MTQFFLLGETGLVDRPKVRENIVGVASEDAWLATMANFRRLCSLADGKTNEPGKYFVED